MKHSERDSDEKGKIMDKKIKEKIIAGLKKDTVVYITFEDGTGVEGIIEDIEYHSNLNGESWHEILLEVGNKSFKYDSREIFNISKSIVHEDNDVILCKNMFEIYDVPHGLSDRKFVKHVIDNWEKYNDNAKDELSSVIAASMNGEILQEIFDMCVYMQKSYEEDRTKVIKLMADNTNEMEKTLKVLKEKKELEEKYEKLSETFKKSYTGAYLLSLIAEAWKKEERII